MCVRWLNVKEINILGSCDTPSIGRNNHKVFWSEQTLEFIDKHILRKEIVNGGLVKEALDLTAVKIDGDDSVGSHRLYQLGNGRCRDWNAWLCLAILSSITKVGNNGVDALGRRESEGVDEEKQLHEVLVDIGAGGLDEIHISSSNILFDVDIYFSVSELLDNTGIQAGPDMLYDLTSEVGVGISRNNANIEVLHVCRLPVVRK